MISLEEIRAFERATGIGQSDTSKSTRAGQKDGKINLPPEDASEPTGFEKSLIADFVGHVRSFNRLSEAKASELERRREKARYELEEDNPKQIEILTSDNKSELDSIERQFGPRSAAYENAQTLFTDAKRDHQAIVDLLKRPLQLHFVQMYIPFMLALSLAEVWINRLAFELFFESNPIISLALATAVGAVLIFFAHISGSILKKSQCVEIDPPKASMFWALFGLNAVVIILSLFLAKMRQALVSINAQQGMSFSDILGDEFGSLDGLTQDVAPSVMDVFGSGGLGQEGIFLLIINLVVYLCGFIAAFYRHDSHPDYEKLTKSLEKKRQTLESIRSKYESRTEETNRKFRSKFSFLEESARMKEAELNEFQHLATEINRVRDTKIEEALHAVAKQINAYRSANVASRSAGQPKYFELEIEGVLRNQIGIE